MITLRSPKCRRSTMQPFAISRAVARARRSLCCAADYGQYLERRVVSVAISSSSVRSPRLRSKHVPDRNRHGVRFESCFGHIAPIVTVGRALLELNHRYGKLRRLPTKE